MDQTAIQAGHPPHAGNGTALQAGPPPVGTDPAKAQAAPRRRPKHPAMRALEALADLRITVVLFVLSFILVFYGTWAQVDRGIWTVVNQYFRSALVWIPLKVVLLRSVDVPGYVPYPGGWLLGGALMVNLLAAHVVRFKMSWRRSGILLLHAGIIVMMLGELVTGIWAVEGHMSILTGSSSNFVEHSGAPELAFVDPSDPKQDRVVVVPAALLREGGVIRDDKLPVDIEVLEYMVNSKLIEPPADRPNPATAGNGKSIAALSLPEGAGVDTDSKIDEPAVYLTFKDKKTGAVLGTHLFALRLSAMERFDWVRVGDTAYQVSLRFKRSYRDYTLHLTRFDQKFYPGTKKAKDFSSYIRLVDPSHNEDRDVRIYMNNPLRYHGETFYQSSVTNDENGQALGTVLQVVKNPGWLMPYISCLMVSGGMLIHFGISLFRFIEKRAA
jgi:hypothetical protein